ncbi:DUF2169 family type VI secretion system accessory protein [Ralstonia nicotianae]
MEFVNHTPFPALAFAGLDQFSQSFHVFALRQTFTWSDTGELEYAEDQAPLCESDECFGDSLQGSVQQESDLCPYKPRCDVIVNATAYPPRRPDGSAPGRFDIQLVVSSPGSPAPLPLEPQGLNPLMPASPEQMQAWRREVERARKTLIPGQRLIDKTLTVTGERQFTKRASLLRLVAALVRVGTLGIVRLPAWRLTAPQPASVVPVRLERAFGGECRVEADSKAADRVSKRYRLTQEQADGHPDAPCPPAAHDAYQPNPAGLGFVRNWYLEASGANSVPAAQIEYPERPVALEHFNRVRAGELGWDVPVAGLGVRPKGHPERAKLVGTVDREFIEGDAPLPRDFDFAVWNAAWPDQQVDSLQGDEMVELTNLCAPETPGVQVDAQGNSVLRLQLKPMQCMLAVRMESGFMFLHPMKIDTLLLEPEQRRLTLVWRAVLGDVEPIRKVEAQLFGANEQAFMEQIATVTKQRMAGQNAHQGEQG